MNDSTHTRELKAELEKFVSEKQMLEIIVLWMRENYENLIEEVKNKEVHGSVKWLLLGRLTIVECEISILKTLIKKNEFKHKKQKASKKWTEKSLIC
jgi:hypothetical protein